MRNSILRQWLASGVAAGALAIAAPAAAEAPTYSFDLASKPMTEAVQEVGRQAGVNILVDPGLVAGRRAPALQGEMTTQTALAQLLEGTGLEVRETASNSLLIRRAVQDPQGGSAGGGSVEALIVTAQKREEAIQDVPIAISAFSQKDLEAQKIEGGFDLLKAIPNVTFTKTNFTSYNFQIRGIGTQSISATSDPGVAVSFNNMAIIQNRLFEQEYLDVERVEVLRGPQGTLYGRNATAGVINVISAKPKLGEFLGDFKLEAGNYNSKRARGMVNIPLGDTLAVRLAAAATLRDGYTYNSRTDNDVDGRDLWTGRLSIGWEPNDRFRANALWEHFEEDDSRLRTGKQLCHRDPGPEEIGSTPIWISNPSDTFNDEAKLLRPALFSQGCQAGSLYDDGAFDTPNGLALPLVFGTAVLGRESFFTIGYDSNGDPTGILRVADPYGGKRQSTDLREIESLMDPRYRAKADLFELSVDFDITDDLSFSSQTAYVKDETYSFQDFNRFNTDPVFVDTAAITPRTINFGPGLIAGPWTDLAPGGIFCDPQLGCSDSIVGFDISQASAEQFSQEFRLQSNFDGPLNFSVGANYTKFDVLVDYYIMFNLITAVAASWPFNSPVNGNFDLGICSTSNFYGSWFWGPDNPVPTDHPESSCPHVDLNPVPEDRNFEGDGHNYFRSKNPYELESWAGFGEIYWEFNDTMKLTAGLRYTEDKKAFTNVPTQVLLAPSAVAGGTVASGYPSTGVIDQKWGEWTGRFGIDWKTAFGFTDSTLLYAFYSRGYKGGGANPPKPGFADYDWFVENLTPEELAEFAGIPLPILELTADEYPDTFEPEFVDALEIGAKNTLLDGAMTVNATAFYYDYRDYQVSQIRDRTAVNENFDATMWGLELETMFSPTRNLQIIGNFGYLSTRIADGERSIDIMNRTGGDPDYTVVKSWLQLPSNCAIPTEIAEIWAQQTTYIESYWSLCGGIGGLIGWLGQINAVIDPNTGDPYTPLATDSNGDRLYPELNGGAGLYDELGGNELPNSPHWTANVGAQYGFDMPRDWRMTVRGDLYWQSQSFHRVYNTKPYDKLHGWYNANLSMWAENDELGLKVEIYVKNVLDASPITGAFLNSDDTGLTTNVFMLDPRLIGVSVRKSF